MVLYVAYFDSYGHVVYVFWDVCMDWSLFTADHLVQCARSACIPAIGFITLQSLQTLYCAFLDFNHHPATVQTRF